MKKLGLTNNQLKIIAMVTMTLDHIGYVLFPTVKILDILGRLAFPIYAFMIAEGCRHTRSMVRYFGGVALLAALCQLVYYFAMDSLYMSILVTFSLSIALVGLLKLAQKQASVFSYLLLFSGLFTVFFLCQLLPGKLPNTDYCIDYGFIGVMIPVCIYIAKDKITSITMMVFGLACLAMATEPVQWWAFLSIPLLMLYNGRRGRKKMKWFFYLFYPVHLLIIQAIAYLI